MMKQLGDSEKRIVEEIFNHVKQQTEKLVVPLVKVGLRETAKDICHSKGLSTTKVLHQKN